MDIDPAQRSTPSGASEETRDVVSGNPFVHFMISETWAGLASVLVYALFRCAALATQLINEYLPLTDARPAEFLEQVLSWGAAFSSAATFSVISIYQLLVLVKRLKRSWDGQ